jgi:hypothetical protein
MNSATASDLLGGSTRAVITNNACTFTVRQPASFKSIRIQVEALPTAGMKLFERHCIDPMPVSGLGNEAFACRVKTKKRTVVERLAGRVRNQAFVVEVSSNAPHAEAARLLDIAKQTAGQVAGNLF